MDPRIVQVMASLNGLHEVVLVMTSDGVMAADVRPAGTYQRVGDRRAERAT